MKPHRTRTRIIVGASALLLAGSLFPALAQQPSTPLSQNSAPMFEWYAGINGQRSGPFQTPVLSGMIQRKEITTDTLVWRDGMADWMAAGNVPELSSLFRPSLPGGTGTGTMKGSESAKSPEQAESRIQEGPITPVADLPWFKVGTKTNILLGAPGSNLLIEQIVTAKISENGKRLLYDGIQRTIAIGNFQSRIVQEEPFSGFLELLPDEDGKYVATGEKTERTYEVIDSNTVKWIASNGGSTIMNFEDKSDTLLVGTVERYDAEGNLTFRVPFVDKHSSHPENP